ncbi:MAG: hypothetical protein Q9185_006059 [Variospora sp. 1 TL-2023]
MKKTFEYAASQNISSGGWKKLSNVVVNPGRTSWPSSPRLQESVGVRFDFKREEQVQEADNTVTTYNTFNVQANAGNKVPDSVKNWAKKNGGTHAVMATARVKKGGTVDDVKAAFKEVSDFVVAGKDVEEEQRKAEEARKAKEKTGC